MSDDQELRALSDYVRNEAGYRGPLSGDDDLLEKRILDSFSIVSLAVFAQQHFGVEFEDTDMTRSNLCRLNALAELIRQRRSGIA